MSLRALVAKHLPGEHDQLKHGVWAKALVFSHYLPATRWGNGTYESWHRNLTASQTDVIDRYRSEGHHLVNTVLRGLQAEPTTDWGRRQLTSLRSGLDKLFAEVPPLPEDLIVYRSVNAKVFAGLKKGNLFKDAGYSSTSLLEDQVVGRGGPKSRTAVILVPKGTRALPLFGLGGRSVMYDDELEILLPRGSRFRVKSTEGGETQNWDAERSLSPHIWLELLP